jgi:2-keto-4-pentenoate hydratase/2-oxohepta-3-ene-1,7-dioic acid hydratase in catechol pathway
MSVRLVRYDGDARPAWGVVTGEGVVPLPTEYITTADALGDGVKLARTLAADPDAERVPLPALRLLHPASGARIICQGANYRSHMAESGMDPGRAFNMLFTKSTASLTGPDDDIVRPSHVACWTTRSSSASSSASRSPAQPR